MPPPPSSGFPVSDRVTRTDPRRPAEVAGRDRLDRVRSSRAAAARLPPPRRRERDAPAAPAIPRSPSSGGGESSVSSSAARISARDRVDVRREQEPAVGPGSRLQRPGRSIDRLDVPLGHDLRQNSPETTTVVGKPNGRDRVVLPHPGERLRDLRRLRPASRARCESDGSAPLPASVRAPDARRDRRLVRHGARPSPRPFRARHSR